MDSYKLPRVASWILVLVAVSSLYSMLGLMQIDNIINRDLYNYNLRFDLRWATPYWTIIRVVLAFGWFNIIAAIAFQLYLFAHRRRKAEHITTEGSVTDPLQLAERRSLYGSLKRNRRIAYSLLALGLVALLVSVFYASSALAFVGLSLTFWGALLLYITPKRQVEVELLNATMFSTLSNIEKLMSKAIPGNKGIYLPSKYREGLETSLIFIPSKMEQAVPRTSHIDEAQAKDVFLTPPGLALSKLFEKELRMPFTKAGFDGLRERLPRVFVEELGIAENMSISKDRNMITVEITNHVFNEICQETRKLQKTHVLTGCPLCSAIACTLAETTESPLAIESENQSQDGKSTKVLFRLIGDLNE